jgi:hypothetical protein
MNKLFQISFFLGQQKSCGKPIKVKLELFCLAELNSQQINSESALLNKKDETVLKIK